MLISIFQRILYSVGLEAKRVRGSSQLACCWALAWSQSMQARKRQEARASASSCRSPTASHRGKTFALSTPSEQHLPAHAVIGRAEFDSQRRQTRSCSCMGSFDLKYPHPKHSYCSDPGGFVQGLLHLQEWSRRGGYRARHMQGALVCSNVLRVCANALLTTFDPQLVIVKVGIFGCWGLSSESATKLGILTGPSPLASRALRNFLQRQGSGESRRSHHASGQRLFHSIICAGFKEAPARIYRIANFARGALAEIIRRAASSAPRKTTGFS